MERLLWKVFGDKDLVALIGRYLSMEDGLSLFWAIPCLRLDAFPWIKQDAKFGRMIAIVRMPDGRIVSHPCTHLCDVAHFFHQSKLSVCFVDRETGIVEIVLLPDGNFYFCHITRSFSERPIGFAHLTLF